MNKPTFTEIAARILSFIPVTILLFIFAMMLFFKCVFGFIIYGGEFITYHKRTRKTIVDILEKVEKNDPTRVRKHP
jgi:hypothetical protein